jgi:2-hydroxy-3-oxopropionate reductase
MVKRTFDPGFRIELASEGPESRAVQRRQMGVALPNTATAQELFNACAAHGRLSVGSFRDGARARAIGEL